MIESPGWINSTPLIEECAKELHQGLGGNGWAYSNYGEDELRYKMDSLESGVTSILIVLRRRGLITSQGLELIQREMGE